MLLLFLCFWLREPSTVRAQGSVTETPADTVETQALLPGALETSFTLDGVLISVQAASLPSQNITVSDPGSASQVATAVSFKPFREFSVTAIPFGTTPPTEALPIAGPGGKTTYERVLRNARLQQGGNFQVAPTVSLFGQQTSGLQTALDLNVDGPIPKPVLINEWVVEAGERMWIIRWSEEQSTVSGSLQSGNFPGRLVLTSSSINNPSTVFEQPAKNSAFELNQNPLVANLPAPLWWNGGNCDTPNYFNMGGVASKSLGAVYRGAPACGPRPYYDTAPDVLVRFYSGSFGVFEWECVEYSMRFLYLAYGIAPYSANGSQVVWNYSGSLLKKVTNGTAGLAPQPDDVLSYGATSTTGHTSVVAASNVNASGNGSITVIEENAAASGSASLTVTNWTVNGDAGAVSGWLTSNKPPQTLSVSKSGTGGGTITSDLTGINCGLTCSYAFPYNQAVTLTATANSSSIFTGWSGAGCSGTGACTVTMSLALSVTANFTLASFHNYLQLLPR